MSNVPDKALNCIIIDKSQVTRNTLARFCNKSEQIFLHGTFNSLNHALTECNAVVDLVLLDLEPEETIELGFVSQMLGDPEFIFTSPNKEAAFPAFEYGAIDFLKKPIEFVRFKQAISKVLKHKKNTSGRIELPSVKTSDNALFNWNIIQLLLTRSNRLTYQVFEYAHQSIQEQLRAQMTNATLLQLHNNQQLARVLNYNHTYFTEISMVKIEPVMQNAMKELLWEAQQKGITFKYSNENPGGTTPANPEILSLLMAQILAIMIRCAPMEGEIKIDVRIAHQELTIDFHCGGLILDEGIMKKINEAIPLFDGDRNHALGHTTEGALINYFLERMDAEVFVETSVEQGISIHFSFVGKN